MSFLWRPEDGALAFLSPDDVEAIHRLCLMPGNPSGWLKKGDLLGALARPENHVLYEAERDLTQLAALYWHGISVAHAFVDGNKRTGLMCAFAFLEAHGIEIDPSVPDDEPGIFTDKCFQQKRFTVPVLAHYLRSRCRWIADTTSGPSDT